MMERLKMQTKNLADENYKKLVALFPNAVTEMVNSDGEVIRAIDADVLRQEISSDVVEGPQERYQFTWPDKKKSVVLANQPIAKTLRLVREKSVGRDGTPGSIDTENLYIEGDNLDALKLLQETYLGKIKVIYIDPPYNTGNDFVYSDNFSQETADYIEISGQFDEKGNRLFPNLESNGRFHTDWLNMLYPRLKIAKDLLSEDGLIFISIDDNEQSNLRKICDELFGSEKFVAQFIWEKRVNRENRKEISVRHDYILCYSKQSSTDNTSRVYQLPMNEKALANYGNPDNDPRGPWKSDPAHAQAGHGTPSQFYTLVAPNGRKHELPSGRCWLYTKKEMEKAISENRIWFGKDGNGVPRIKTYLYSKDRGLTPESIIFAKDSSTNEKAKNDLKQLFDGKAVFETPKPPELLEFLLQISSKDDIILDFFSGSASLAQAILQLNANNKEHRKFIMVQLEEKTDPSSEAYKAGYHTICDIGEDRIRLVGRKINAEYPLLANEIDVGFRVFRVDSSNMKDVFYRPNEITQTELDSQAYNIKADRTAEDLLFQIMLDLGILLSSKIEETIIAGKKVFSVADGYLIACLDNNITEETVKAIAVKHPFYAIFRDSGMSNDSVMTNFDQIFETYSPQTQRRVL